MNWPIGDGEGFQGVLDRATNKVRMAFIKYFIRKMSHYF